MIAVINPSFLRGQKIDQHRKKWRGNGYSQSGSIKFGNLINTFELVTLKVLHSNFRQVKSLSTLASRRVAGAKRTFEFESFDLARMQGSGVVSTWSGGRPSVNLLSTDGNTHGVSRVERFNLAPTNGKSGKWVGNSDCLIVEDDFGSYEEQINAVTYEGSPSDGIKVALQITNHDGLEYQDSGEAKGDRSRDPRTSSSEKVGILHLVIFSQSNPAKGLAA